ncbi:MerC family mercury resistance protein [Aquisalimonas asiatica]|uniref:Ubiquinone/menaquinone biosynthesis C-methylase UbiE n=1 Tax=Aquisalimonas asiatica TaxID=406100 RepID=A0A1H8UEZ8_9GAMM|nr:MerC family mercury resistance protein [Aquisalimonas asiatica]SEP01444.1 Ubiquinone/menaquinone biosynthesis C-methylase UbiE [Aquisalimonas asiatica]
MVAILGYSRQQIVAAVRDMYTAVAASPDSPFHFPVGRAAATAMGYPHDLLDRLPATAVSAFAGVGYPFSGNAVQPGHTVLDIGAGAGCDTLVAAEHVGPDGHVIALDLTGGMTRRIRTAAREAGAANVSVVEASAERLPLADESIDSITSNGALNLVPDKRGAVAEMFRVLRPGGRLQIADVVIRRPVTVDCSDDPRLWVECVVGATVDEDLLALFRDAGFEDIRVVRSLDYFAHSPSAQTREIAASFGAHSVELAMQRAERPPGFLWHWARRLNPVRGVKSLWRRGAGGVASLALALLTCYGTMAALAMLAATGTAVTVDEGLWAALIGVFAILTVVAIAPGIRYHRSAAPVVVGAAGALVVCYALFVHYTMGVELAGFLALAVGVGWDIHLRRRAQARVLGVQGAARPR